MPLQYSMLSMIPVGKDEQPLKNIPHVNYIVRIDTDLCAPAGSTPAELSEAIEGLKWTLASDLNEKESVKLGAEFMQKRWGEVNVPEPLSYAPDVEIDGLTAWRLPRHGEQKL